MNVLGKLKKLVSLHFSLHKNETNGNSNIIANGNNKITVNTNICNNNNIINMDTNIQQIFDKIKSQYKGLIRLTNERRKKGYQNCNTLDIQDSINDTKREISENCNTLVSYIKGTSKTEKDLISAIIEFGNNLNNTDKYNKLLEKFNLYIKEKVHQQ